MENGSLSWGRVYLSRLKLIITRHEQFPSFHNDGCLESSGPLLISGNSLTA